MAMTVELFGVPPLATPTLKVYPLGIDSIANGAGGDVGTPASNRTGYVAWSVAEDLDGIHTLHVEDGSGNLVFAEVADLQGDGSTWRNVSVSADAAEVAKIPKVGRTTKHRNVSTNEEQDVILEEAV